MTLLPNQVDALQRARAAVRVQCAWCGTVSEGADGRETAAISHGICPACAWNHFGVDVISGAEDTTSSLKSA